MRNIPKIINYCWFGRGSKTKTMLHCIESWKKYMPDYQIIEWNEDNFSLMDAPKYVQEAYQEKKYAFVSDYVRLYALRMYGGIYMDTDVEVVKNFDVLLENVDLLVGFELRDSIMTGLIASIPEHTVVNEFLNYYKDLKFINPDGSYNLQINPIQFTTILKKYGLKLDGEKQFLDTGIAVYPIDYFCAFDLHNDHTIVSDNTYTIHHYTGTWNEATLKKKFFKRRLALILGNERYERFKAWYKDFFK